MTSLRIRLSAAALSILMLTGGAASASAATPGGTSSASAPRDDRIIGVALPSHHYDPRAVLDHERLTGHDVDVLQTFISWKYDGEPTLSDFPTYRARQIHTTGSTLEITWNPSNPRNGSRDPEFALAGIARGDHDAYVRRFAAGVRNIKKPVRIRFAHEMNGKWQPWNESRSGNRAGDYARAWRHLHDVFENVGATNAVWVWSPNVVGPDQTPLAGLYPGDAYVDEVGIDGYSSHKSDCPAPARLFTPTVIQVQRLTRRPIRLAEIGVATTCSDRARWVTSLFDYLDATPAITGFTWWQRSGNGYDWRVTQGPELTAMRAGLARPPATRAR